MNSLVYRRLVKGLAAIGIFIIIVMPGEVIGLLFELLHILWELFVELLDILFEGTESGLDHIVEHLFETDLHTTQVIVFYIMMSVAALIAYRLYLLLPKLYYRLRENLLAAWVWHKTRIRLYWQSLTLINKIKFVAMAIGMAYAVVFFSF